MDKNTWIYHKTKKPVLVTAEEAIELCTKDWADTPAAFLGEVVDDEVPAVDVSGMNKDELEVFAAEHFLVDLDKRKSLKVLRQEVAEMLEN